MVSSPDASKTDPSKPDASPAKTSDLDLTQLDQQSVWHQLIQHKAYETRPPKRMDRASGVYVTDDAGNELLDAVSGLWCVNVGYGRTELADAAHAQMVELPYTPLTMSHTPAIKLAAKLLELLDFEGKVFFSCSGSEANESAFKIARQYHAQSGGGAWRYKIISRYRAYHGTTMGALSATAQAERRAKYEPLVPGFLHVPPPYCYRCPFGKAYGSCNIECATSIEQTVIHEGPESVAAIIIEPVISGGGVIVPPDEYLPIVRDICDRHGILLIFDEVVNGFGRLGSMLGHELWDVKPDIISFAKGITSGYLPLSATVVRQHIFDAFLDDESPDAHFRHATTYGGHPACAAVALANIDIIERESLPERAERMGRYLMTALSDLIDHPYVGDVRGKGLLLGIELVADKATKAPLDPALVKAVTAHCMANGVIIGRNTNTVPGLANVLIMAPPLVLSEAEADAIASALKDALDAVYGGATA
ncbi:MAG: aminotransferase [Elainellaceae cyanobacterium]